MPAEVQSVRQLFDEVAPHYDRLNDLLSTFEARAALLIHALRVFQTIELSRHAMSKASRPLSLAAISYHCA